MDYHWADEKWEKNFKKLKEDYCNTQKIGKNLQSWINTQRNIFINGIVDEYGTISYNGNNLKKEQLQKLNELGFKWVCYNDRFYKKMIKTTGQAQGVQRVLTQKIDKVLKLMPNEINNKHYIKDINDEFLRQLR